jgi:hypothetical protein
MNKVRGWRDGLFFAVHYDLHASATDTRLGAELTTEHLRTEIQRIRPDWLQCDAKGHPGLASYPTRVGSPAPGIAADALRIHRDVTAELGLPLVVHYSGLLDSRAVELHPDWAVVHADGARDDMKVCPRSDYRDQLMIPQLLELVGDYRVDGIWVDGENWASAPCWCDRCVASFGRPVPKEAGDPEWFGWLEHHRRAVMTHVLAYVQAVRAADPQCEVTSNGVGTSFHPDDVDADLDWLSQDSAPTVSTLLNARAIDSRGRPWELMTWSFITPVPGHPITDPKPAAHLRQEVAIGIACGGGAVLYDLPERSGHLTGWRQQALADLGTWVRERQSVVQGTTAIPQVAVLQSERHHYLHSPPLFLPGEGDEPLKGALHALLDARLAVDLINEATLLRRASDYALIVVPEQEDLSPEAIRALEAYAASGGRLFVTGARAAEVMPELVGAKPVTAPVDGHVLLRAGDGSFRASGTWQPVEPTTAVPVARLLRSWEPADETEDVVVTLNTTGSGRVVAVHGSLFAHHAAYYVPRCRELIAELCRLVEPDLALEVSAPPGLHVTLRRKDDQTIVHLLNMSGWHPLAPVTSHIEHVPPLGPVAVRVRTSSAPRGVRLVPGDADLPWSYAEGWTVIDVPVVDVHAAVVLDGVQPG